MVGGLEHVWADRDPVDAADTTLTSTSNPASVRVAVGGVNGFTGEVHGGG
jgi:hypothetical protein